MNVNEKRKNLVAYINELKLHQRLCLDLSKGYDVHYSRYMYLTGLIKGYQDYLNDFNSFFGEGGIKCK